jgi:hypothetical protein
VDWIIRLFLDAELVDGVAEADFGEEEKIELIFDHDPEHPLILYSSDHWTYQHQVFYRKGAYHAFQELLKVG